MNPDNSNLPRLFLIAALVSMLFGCTTESWKLSSVTRKRDFDLKSARDFFTEEGRASVTTNELIFLEAGANLYDFIYDSRNHALEISLEVNRDYTVTVSGPLAGGGSRIKLTNLKKLSRAIRLKDSTGSVRIGASAVVPPEQRAGEGQPWTLLLGLNLDQPGPAGSNLTSSVLQATLQSLVIYDHRRDLVVAQWTREIQPPIPAREDNNLPNVEPLNR